MHIKLKNVKKINSSKLHMLKDRQKIECLMTIDRISLKNNIILITSKMLQKSNIYNIGSSVLTATTATLFKVIFKIILLEKSKMQTLSRNTFNNL